ncbi:MAG: antitoxin VapB family protein [Nanoarchaeota archaeon]|nr:antitoxin VapB family protein [Nanoarchaeota archaeon]
MMTKVISLSDDAYELLKSLKEEGESFSDVVRKTIKKNSLADCGGLLKEDSKEWGKISKELLEERRKSKPRVLKEF